MKVSGPLETDNRVSSVKKVSWEALQNLRQVRLFAAEDAPSLLGTSLQELYQEKGRKFLHAAEPLSENDLPPGFVKFRTGHLGSGGNTIIAMDVQVQWRCPDKFLFRPAWQVAAGIASTELFAERRRELGALEALYPRINLIPDSPMEPLETLIELKGLSLPEIPVFAVEDEDELEDLSPGGDVTSSLRRGAEKKEPGERVGSSSRGQSSSWSVNQTDRGLNSFFLSEDPNVEAAAAAAYAVLKAKERGALVDHDMLIKILTNPILIATLLQHKQTVGLQLKAASEEIDKVKELGRSLGSTSLESKLFGWPIPLGNKITLPVENMPESANFQAWNTSNYYGSTRPFFGSRSEDKFFPRTEIQGMGAHSSQMLMNKQDTFKDLMQHGIDRSRIDGPRGLTEMELVGNMKPLPTERHRPPFQGLFSQLGPGSQHPGVSASGKGDAYLHARFGGEQSQSRFQKPCIYFNTPKGCRRGASCFYMHSTASEQSYGEQPRTEFLSYQSAKRQKFGASEKD